jgi:hypothetical protein
MLSRRPHKPAHHGSSWPPADRASPGLYSPSVRVAALVVLALAACNSSGGHGTLETMPAPTLPTRTVERAAPPTTPVEFKTDAPQRLDRFSALPLSSEEEYRKTIIPLKDRLIPIRVEPADLREPALYGFNVILDGSNRSVISVRARHRIRDPRFAGAAGRGAVQRVEVRPDGATRHCEARRPRVCLRVARR